MSDKQRLGPAVLFFGCRHRNHDFIYEAELQGAVEAGALSALHVAFSRMGPQKDYVQHHIEAQAGGCCYNTDSFVTTMTASLCGSLV